MREGAARYHSLTRPIGQQELRREGSLQHLTAALHLSLLVLDVVEYVEGVGHDDH
jgi:hypothetical protein